MKHLLSLASLFALATSAAAADRPNILLVLSDDHSVPHVGCYGIDSSRSHL